MHARVRIQTEDFDLSAETAALREGDGDVGAVVAFVGTVRDQSGRLSAMELEHYPGMTEAAISRMAEQAASRFALRGVSVIHRVGRLAAHEQIVMVLTSARHRHAAFEGCEFLMDYLKTQAPFWKKELSADGQGQWVDARAADDTALARWGITAGNAA